jgi:hypothetical protein
VCARGGPVGWASCSHGRGSVVWGRSKMNNDICDLFKYFQIVLN